MSTIKRKYKSKKLSRRVRYLIKSNLIITTLFLCKRRSDRTFSDRFISLRPSDRAQRACLSTLTRTCVLADSSTASEREGCVRMRGFGSVTIQKLSDRRRYPELQLDRFVSAVKHRDHRDRLSHTHTRRTEPSRDTSGPLRNRGE